MLVINTGFVDEFWNKNNTIDSRKGAFSGLFVGCGWLRQWLIVQEEWHWDQQLIDALLFSGSYSAGCKSVL